MIIQTREDWDDVQRLYADGRMSDREYLRTMNREGTSCCRHTLPTRLQWIAQQMAEKERRRKVKTRRKLVVRSKAQARLLLAKYARKQITPAALRRSGLTVAKLRNLARGSRLPQYVGGRRPQRRKFCVQFGKHRTKATKSGWRRYCKHFAWHGGRPSKSPLRTSTHRKRRAHSRKGTTLFAKRRSRPVQHYRLSRPRVSWKRSPHGRHRVRTLAWQR